MKNKTVLRGQALDPWPHDPLRYRNTAERTRIYADSLHEPYAKKPWFKHCCKCCKYRVNYPVAGAICSMVSCAETNCQLVKKWIETRIK